MRWKIRRAKIIEKARLRPGLFLECSDQIVQLTI